MSRARNLSDELPREFRDFRGYHAGETIVVCGCGSSLKELAAPERFITIGVNDVGRLFDPDYLVVLNTPHQFSAGRFQYVAKSRARAVFTQLDLGIGHPHVVRFRLGQRGGTDVSDPESLPYTRNSPYPALCLAMFMGAKRIGLIGVDFTDHHFFAQTGVHSLGGEVGRMEREYSALYETARRGGIEIFNLSAGSRLVGIPKVSLEEFWSASGGREADPSHSLRMTKLHSDLKPTSLRDEGRPCDAIEETFSRRLKPHSFGVANGTAKAVPLQSAGSSEEKQTAGPSAPAAPPVGMTVSGVDEIKADPLASLKMTKPGVDQDASRAKIFFVNYGFLSCGHVFRDGLAHAAEELGVPYAAAMWDDPLLPEKVEAFGPDLLFVVHGRKFSARWGDRFARYRSAVWLLDEPYEVDDTSQFSQRFDTVFVNDPSTLSRHGNAHYLPVCYDPRVHTYLPIDERPHSVGFIGGHNREREMALGRLARKGLLSYVVGGPWRDAAVAAVCRSGNIPAEETAALYRKTRIVVNLFRTRHHYNRSGIAAVSLNPRVYEALACGALVISEHRPELDMLCPELPIFRTLDEMEVLVEQFLRDEGLYARMRKACIRRFAGETYAARLSTILGECFALEGARFARTGTHPSASSGCGSFDFAQDDISLKTEGLALDCSGWVDSVFTVSDVVVPALSQSARKDGAPLLVAGEGKQILHFAQDDSSIQEQNFLTARDLEVTVAALTEHEVRDRETVEVMDTAIPVPPVPVAAAPAVALPHEMDADWIAAGECVEVQADGVLQLRKDADAAAGSERGLAGRVKHRNVVLEFEVLLSAETRFLAKVHQEHAEDQSSNSYHVLLRGGQGYLARHNRVLSRFTVPVGGWVAMSLSCCEGAVVVRRNGAEVGRALDHTLEDGYCFLGVAAGEARLRNVRAAAPMTMGLARENRASYNVLYGKPGQGEPKLSIVTTVFDRVECLERCIQSVQALTFKDYEHIVVADDPPQAVVDAIQKVIAKYSAGSTRLIFANLNARKNDWGISPAAAGLAMARGKYLCFLSDDNGYEPWHFDKLIAALDRDASVGFVYSSCLYAGVGVLNMAPPRPGRIDLGQPLFRRALFDKYMGGTLPFREYGWDWRMIERFIRSGVRWQHVNEATFIFRLAQYPQLFAKPGARASEISYCIACYRPRYARLLIEDLIAKTTAPYEVLLWMNVADAELDAFVEQKKAVGAPIRVIGRTEENIGMAAYLHLFAAARSEMVVQIDDDVVCVSPRIAETAQEVFGRFPQVGMLTADVWQDEFTTGARPPLEQYRMFDREHGLYDGPIDGWFAVYRKSALEMAKHIRAGRYFGLGCEMKRLLEGRGQKGLLCRRMKVFHVTDPGYVSHFGMLDEEIAKFRGTGRVDHANWYAQARHSLPPDAELSARVEQIRASLVQPPA